jgi:hypothetical protein
VASYSAKKAFWMSDLSFDDAAVLNFQVETSLSSSEPPVYWSSLERPDGQGPAASVTKAVRVETVALGRVTLGFAWQCWSAGLSSAGFVPGVGSATANFAQMLSASSVEEEKFGIAGVELTPCVAFPSSSNMPSS